MNSSIRDLALTPVAIESPARESTASELRYCVLSVFTRWMYPRLRGPGSSMTRRILVRALFALEGGAMRSGTVRRIMAEVHGLEVGAHSYGCFDPVRFPTGTQIGRYVSVGPGVSAFRRNHPTDRLSMHPYFYHPSYGAEVVADVPTQPLSIEAGSWLGAHVMILPGCRRIGQGAVVAAGAVLTRDVPDYAVVGGNPARLIRYRFEAADIAAAQATRWWRRRPSRLRESQCMSDTWAGQLQTNEDVRA